MASMLFKGGLLAVGGSLAESKFGPKNDSLFGLTPLLLCATGFWVTVYGMNVGRARTKYMDLATKDGEANVKERYGLPNLYAQGTSKHALAFNCIQRSHQHIFEGFTQLCVASLTAAVSYPVSAAVGTLVYIVGRVTLTQGYAAADGDASKRYSSPLAVSMWYGLVATYTLGLLSSVKIMAKDTMW